MNPSDTAKVTPATGPVTDQVPKKESGLRVILGIFVLVVLLYYLPKYFSEWFGLSNPSAFALAVFSAVTVSNFVDRPREFMGFKLKRPGLTYFVFGAVLAIVSYVVGLVYHFWMLPPVAYLGPFSGNGVNQGAVYCLVRSLSPVIVSGSS